ncbi:DUF4410 domain-containing protein [Methylotetracoccus oryzae]|uniref:DUF4410 domain-containing protein n=1 Tax=Methylotetracoccus oryzae TaxID=1919059 RepID=UPI0013A5930A|nr:DUF4410 domain-containing protein [Methylotetracoccus oryzae]
MSVIGRSVFGACLLSLLAGCAGSSVTSHQNYASSKRPRPDHILVYDFGATPDDVDAGSSLQGKVTSHDTPQTSEQVAAGRKLGAEVAEELVAEIRRMGLPAARGTGGPKPVVGDLVIKGYFLSVDQGSAEKRVLVGFGKGAAELKAAVEGYEVTPTGLRLLSRSATDSSGGKKPGLLVGAATLAATGNPVGLIVSGASKAMGEAKGSETIDGQAKKTADDLAEAMKEEFRKLGWI